MGLLAVEKRGVFGERPRGDPRQILFQNLAGPFIPYRLQGSLLGAGREDSCYRRPLEGLVLQGVDKRAMDVPRLVAILQVQDEPGLETAVPGILCFQTLEKLESAFAKGQESLSDRFQAIPFSLHPVVGWILDFLAKASGLAFMPGQDFQVRTVEEDLLFRGLEAQNIADVPGGHRVPVGFKLRETIRPADHQPDLGRVVGESREGLQGALLRLEKKLQRRSFGSVVAMKVGLLSKPPFRCRLEIREILELPAVEQVALDILKRPLHLALGLRPAGTAGDGPAVIMGDKRREGRVKDRPPPFPSQNHGFLVIVEALQRHTAKVGKGVLVSSNQGEKIPPRGELDELAPRITEDVGEALDLYFPLAGKVNLVGAPVHLALFSGDSFKTDDRLAVCPVVLLEKFPENGDPARVTLVLQDFKNSLAFDVGVFGQGLDLFLEVIQLAFADLF